MSLVDDPTPGFAGDNQLLHLLLGLAASARALDTHLPTPALDPHNDPSATPKPAAPDPALLAVLGLVSLRLRLGAALPTDLPPPAPAPSPAATPPLQLMR